MWGFNMLRSYLVGKKFIARVDHQPLLGLLQKVDLSNTILNSWVDSILQFDFEIKYIPGNTNFFADALSRQFEDSTDIISNISSIDKENSLILAAELKGKINSFF